MAERRDLRPEEMATILELAMACPDLTAAKERLLAALTVARTGEGAVSVARPTIEPKSLKELMEAVKLGIIPAHQARRFVNVPQPEPSALRRVVRLGWQRGGAA